MKRGQTDILYFFREQRKFGAPQFQSVRSVSSLSSLCPLVMTMAIFLTLTSNTDLGRLIFFLLVSLQAVIPHSFFPVIPTSKPPHYGWVFALVLSQQTVAVKKTIITFSYSQSHQTFHSFSF